jgi:hypothetical protein
MASIFLVGAEYISSLEITAWAGGIVGVLGAILAFYKVRVSSRVSKNSENIATTKSDVEATIALAAAQIEYVVKPLREELDGYRKRIEAVETELQKEKVGFRRVITLFFEYITNTDAWIAAEVTTPKTKKPELSEELQKYKNGEML